MSESDATRVRLDPIGEMTAERAMSIYRIESALARRMVAPVPVSRLMFAAIIVVYVIMLGVVAHVSSQPRMGSFSYNGALLLGAKVNLLIEQGQWWRLVSSQFLHGGLLHLGVNAVALWMVAPIVERIYGTMRVLVLLQVAAVGGALASFAFTANPSVGASGAIFGLLGACLVFSLRHRAQLPKRFSRALLSQSMFFIGLNIVIGLSEPSIDNAGHMGGLVGGMLFASVFDSEMMTGERGGRPVWFAALASLSLILFSLAMMGHQFVTCTGSPSAFHACFPLQ